MNITVSSANPKYSAQGNILYNKDKSTIISAGNVASIVSITQTVTTIAPYAFDGNDKLQTLHIEHTPNIGLHAFANCENLSEAYFYAYTAPRLSNDAFLNDDFILYVPYSKQGEYNTEFVGYTSRIDSIPITITFVSDGQEIGTLDTYYGARISGLVDPYKEGHELSAWYDNPDFVGMAYKNGELWDARADLTVYADWTPQEFYIIFSGDESVDLEAKPVTYGEKIGNLPPMSKKGHSFFGWKDEYGEYYNENTVWKRTSNLSLYPDFKANTYTITYDGNGGTPSMVSQHVVYGDVVNTFATAEKTGSIFANWNTCADGAGTTVAAPYEYLEDNNITLYAQYSAIVYKVAFDKQGGSEGADGVEAEYGLPMPERVDITPPTRVGYEFQGYYSGKNGSGTKYYNANMTSAADWNFTTAQTLYAFWVGQKYTVTLDWGNLPGFGEDITSASSSDMKYIYFTSLASGTITLWTSHTSGDPYLYLYNGNKGQLASNDDGYGNADSKITYTLSASTNYIVGFRAYGSTSTTGKVYLSLNIDVQYASKMPVGMLTMPKRSGYTFKGYYTGDNGSGIKYYNADMTSANVWNIASNTTLYAYFTANEYTVTLNKQTDVSGTDSVKVTYMSAMPSATAPTRAGYIFQGYYTGTNGSGTRYYDANMKSVRNWDIPSDRTLYAYWKGIQYEIKLYPCGGTGGTQTTTVTYGSELPTTGLTVPTRKGYTLKGYYTAENGYGAKYYDGPGINRIENVVWLETNVSALYAYWEKNFYDVTLNLVYTDYNDVLSIGYGDTVVAGEFSQYIYNRIGYDFQGFYSGMNGTGTKYFDFEIVYRYSDYCYRLISRNQKWNNDYNGDLYAYWTVIDENYDYEVIISNADEPSKHFSIRLRHGSTVEIKAPTITGYTFEKMWVNNVYHDEPLYTLKDVQLKRNLGYGIEDYDYSQPFYLWYPGYGYPQMNNGGLFMVYQKDKTCVAEGTLITLADGSQKAVETLTGNENLLVWNLYAGKFDTAPILFIDKDAAALYNVINLRFSDGTHVKVIDEHAFWDCDLNRYVFLRNDASKYIGHRFNKQIQDANGNLGWTKVQLIDVEIVKEYTTTYSPVTYGHLCIYVNGMLSMPGATTGLINIFEVDGETMQINQEQFEADIATYGLFTYEEFAEIYHIPETIFNAVCGQYLKVSIGKGLITHEGLTALIERYSAFF